MTLKIGHASIDENGKIQGGSAGDQTGKEVCTRNYYMHSKGWYLLRPKGVAHAIAMAEAMLRACNNAYIGYDQGNRLGIIKYGTKTKKKTECDCSSLIRECIIEGTGKDPGNFTTANEVACLEKTGLFEKAVAVTEKTVLYNGDVLVTKTKGHTVMVVSGNSRKKTKAEVYKLKTLKNGSTGNDVTIFESIMKKMGYYKGDIDTDFGSKCVDACNKFQTKYPECGTNGKPDGTWGVKSWKKAFSLLDA